MLEQNERKKQIELIMEHYENPRNFGKINDATISQKGNNPNCGDIITIYFKLNNMELVEQITFEGEGCTISLAAASMVTELIQGKTLSEIERISHDAIMGILGREIVISRPICSTLALNIVREAVQNYRRNFAL